MQQEERGIHQANNQADLEGLVQQEARGTHQANNQAGR